MPLRRLLLLAALLCLASPVAAAHAKGATDAKACGPDGCVAIPEPESHSIMGGVPASPPPRDAAWFDVTAAMFTGPGTSEVLRMRFVPSAGVLRDEGGRWFRPAPQSVAVLRRVTDRIAPYRRAAPAAAGGTVVEGAPWELVLAAAGIVALLAVGAAAMAVPGRRGRATARGLTAD